MYVKVYLYLKIHLLYIVSRITSHMLSSCRDFCDSLWSLIWEDTFLHNGFMIKTVGTTLWVLLWYTVINSIFFLCDVTGRPALLHRYKIQEKRPPLCRDKVIECLRVNAVNLIMVDLVVNVVSYPLFEWSGALHTGVLPSFKTLVWQGMGFRLLEEVGNYYTHRCEVLMNLVSIY